MSDLHLFKKKKKCKGEQNRKRGILLFFIFPILPNLILRKYREGERVSARERESEKGWGGGRKRRAGE